MPKYVLALDQGTTSSRAMLFDHEGRTRASASQEFKQYYPQPGWVEHDATEIWQSQLAVAEKVLADAKVGPQDLAAIGITNQRETVVLWERATGKPLHNAIVWQCRRTAALCDRIRAEGFDRTLRDKTGLVTDAYFSGTKIAWLLENVPGARERAERGELACGTIDTWLIWQLTRGRVHATDVSNASRTLLFNLHTLAWDNEILNYFRIPASLLPEVKSSSEVFGETAVVRRSAAHRRGGGRPTGVAIRTAMFRARHGEEHLRDWLLPVDEHRRRNSTLRVRAAGDGRLGPPRPDGIRAGGQRLHCRGGHPVAAR